MRHVKTFSAFMLLGWLVLPAPAAAQERALSFGNVPFGSDPATVLTTMKRARLSVVSGAPDPAFPWDQRFEGELKGRRVLVSALYDADRRLQKVLVSFLTADEDCVPFYRSLKQELRQQYGAPFVDVERWDYPYSNGGHVGQEHFAIRIGRGMLATAWDRDHNGTGEGSVSLITGENVIVRLAYESPRWGAESERRTRILDADSQGVAAEGAGRSLEDAKHRSGVS